jgi:hypothetical protein
MQPKDIVARFFSEIWNRRHLMGRRQPVVAAGIARALDE